MKNISVIMPVYNVEKYLAESIDSVLNQSYENFELILVDDGSTDGSSKICDEYKNKDQRIIVIHKKNGGLSSARNAGIDICKGNYIFFIDSDDTIPFNALELLWNKIRETESDLCVGNFYHGDTKEVEKLPLECMSGKKALENIYNYNGCFIVAWNKLYDKKIFDNLRYPLGKIHEDDFIAHIILHKASKVAFVNEAIYNYRVIQGSIMNSKMKIGHLDSIEAFVLRIIFCKKNSYVKTKEITEYKLWQEINRKYFLISSNKITEKKRLSQLKSLFNKMWLEMMKCSIFTIKEKIGITVFVLNKNLYKVLFLKEEY